jgi:isocitrate lyase
VKARLIIHKPALALAADKIFAAKCQRFAAQQIEVGGIFQIQRFSGCHRANIDVLELAHHRIMEKVILSVEKVKFNVRQTLNFAP